MRLVEPSIIYKNSYLNMLKEWGEIEDVTKQAPFPHSYNTSDFDVFLKKFEANKLNLSEEGFVPTSTFWLIDESDKIYGSSNLRHSLNDNLMFRGGHIGFGIRADERKKGYATKILELTCIEAKKIGIEKVLVTCSLDNIASNKTILKCNGILEITTEVRGEMINRYWIDLL